MKTVTKACVWGIAFLLAASCSSSVTDPDSGTTSGDFLPFVPPEDTEADASKTSDLESGDLPLPEVTLDLTQVPEDVLWGTDSGYPDLAVDSALPLEDIAVEDPDVAPEVVPEVVEPTGCTGPPDCTPPLLHCLLPAGVCVECIELKHCADGLKCTADACTDNACTYTALEDCCESYLECNDGEICTTDYCADGSCGHTPIPGCCEDVVDCTDDELCSSPQCINNICQYAPLPGCCEEHLDCNDDDPCTSDLCVDTACTHETVVGCCTNDNQCEDGNPCTIDQCESGHCLSILAEDCCTDDSHCDDGDPCSTDLCILDSGTCQHAQAQCCAEDEECNDGDPCTIDSCDGFICVHNNGEGCASLTPTMDVWLEGANSNKNGFDFLIVGKTGEFQKKRTLIQFDLSEVPQGASVIEATLRVFYFASTKPGWLPNEQGIDRTVQAHRLLVPWHEGQANSEKATNNTAWNVPYIGVDGSDALAEPEDAQLWTCEQYNWQEFEVTDATQFWVDNPEQNYGLLIYATNDNVSGMDMRFYSREHNGDASLRPKLQVVWE